MKTNNYAMDFQGLVMREGVRVWRACSHKALLTVRPACFLTCDILKQPATLSLAVAKRPANTQKPRTPNNGSRTPTIDNLVNRFVDKNNCAYIAP